jgi:hypothetical protein
MNLKYFDIDKDGCLTVKGKDDTFYWFYVSDFKTGMLKHLASKNWFTWDMFHELCTLTEDVNIQAEAWKEMVLFDDVWKLKRNYWEVQNV